MKYWDNKMKPEDKNYMFIRNTDLADIWDSELKIKYIALKDVPAINVEMGSEFKRHNDRAVLTRVEFENKPTVMHRDVENIAAITYSKDIYLIPCDEFVREITL
jgi:hypothetical protein